MLFGLLYIFFGRMSVRSYAHFLIGLFAFLILSCMSCLYILDINPLSVALFANIFSQSTGCLFILFMVSFDMKKLLSLIRSYLFISVFISIILRDESKKYILLQFISKSFLPIFSSNNLFSFRSLIHFEFNLYMVLQYVVTLFFYMYLSSFPSTTYLRDCLFSNV